MGLDFVLVFETGSHLSIYHVEQVTSNSQRSSCLSIPILGLEMCYHATKTESSVYLTQTAHLLCHSPGANSRRYGCSLFNMCLFSLH